MDNETTIIRDEQICVLGVDDRPGNLVALEAVLETLGITFVRAYSGREALEYVLKKEFALILLDVQMPDMDGFETASLMRSNRKTEHIPIIFVTAINFQPKHVFKGYDTGAVDYLFKPIDPHILRSKVKVFIELFRQKEILKYKALELEKANRYILAQQRALKTSTMRFTTAFDQSFQFMAILDAQGRVLELNAMARQLCDAAHRKTVGQYLWDILWPGNAEQHRSLKTVIERSMAGEPTSDEGIFFDKNKEMHSFTRTVSPVRDDSGEIVCIAVQGQDISERRRAEEEKQKLENQLRQAQKLEAIGTLAGGIAHDFNNILSIILGSAEMARRVSGGTRDFDRYLDRILMAGNKAKDLIRQILIFSRQSEIKRVAFHPGTVVRESIRLLRSTLPSSIEIRQKIDNRTGHIIADPTQFHQILLNLCTNAFHAMEKSGGILTISMDSLAVEEPAFRGGGEISPGRYIRLTVGDTGAGIGPENLARIFDPYFTTKEVGKGTGMGLSIVHGIVAGYGGFVEVESELSKGSSFFVHLPQTDDPGQGEEESCLIGSGGETILLIDDDEVVLEMTRVMIEMLGYTVVSKKDWVDALKLLGENPHGYDLVILNQAMACLKGKELSRQLLEIRPDLPIVLCMSHGTPPTGMEYWEPGIAELAYKPLAIEDLSALIRNSLGKR
ncbi:MAG: multi-sensor hybrid histidine kinase [uncultured bacterium]|nr:MAG: multi-sensor hybrid histidine kinase [uncultured bacterium]